jgi:hypothetical protein
MEVRRPCGTVLWLPPSPRSLLSQQRAGFGEDRDVEGGRKPIDDRVQLFERLGGVAGFDAELSEVAGAVQFKQARLLITRSRARSSAPPPAVGGIADG